ncbi:MAG: hypothetical protein ABIQ52_10950 [Vicinamibacterales bacterium]
MLPSSALYFTSLGLCACVLAVLSFRADRFLGWIVLFALCVNVSGATAIGWWAERVHGRNYMSPDEVGYLWEGERLLLARRTGDTSFVRATVGIFAPINGAVMAVAGPGYKPMRVTTALVGAIGVAAAFWLALLLYRSQVTARIAAFLCATSPLMILFSWSDLRERWIATAATLVLVAGVLTIQRPTVRRVLGLMAAVWILTELRHYWGTLAAYLVIAGSLLFGAPRWSRRIGNTAIVATAMGLALWVVTESFLGLGIRHETVRKYIAVAPTEAGQSGSARASTSDSPGAQPGSRSTAASMRNGAAADAGRAIPYSGPTLGVPAPARRPTLKELAGNLMFVLFGRVRARVDGGQFASVFLLPEALWSVLLIPLAVAGFVVAVRRGQLAVLIPAAYVAAIMALFTWVHGEEWTTYRFRNLYWPELLVLVAGGVTWAYEWWAARRSQAAVSHTGHAPGTAGAARTS